MNTKRTFLRIVVFLSITLLVAGAVQMPRAAWASMEDAAIFYEELNPHGVWVEYENYGPVWYPTQVQENWRPYVDGRWTPADEGYVFETQEPWGWATYHYGNWMPTEEYGWVWVPGRTWYPNTVTWRTSPDTESPDESYIGWAPIPPPNYVPQPGYYPEGYYGGGPYRGPVENLISAPFWIFVRAASFLLGFSEPYAPRYSYWGCGCLAPPPVVPYYYNRTVVVHNYYAPDYYPRGIWAGRGYYNWGPPIPYVSRVTRIKQVNINNYVRQVNIYQRRNVAPPPGLVARRSYFRQVLPPAMVQHRPLPRGQRIHDVQAARANLVRPHLLKAEAIKGAPAFRAQIPKTPGNRGRDGQWRRGVPGAALPASAMMRPNQQMENHVRKIPSSQRIQPVSPRGRQWQVPGMSGAPGTPGGQPAGFHKRRAPEAVTPGAATPRAAPPGAERARMRPGGPQGIPPTMKPSATPGTPGVAGAAGGRGHRAATIEGRPSRAPSPSPAAMTPARSQPGKGQPPGAWSRQKPTPPAAATRGKPQAQGQQRHYTPSSPGPGAAGPVRVQPPGRPPRSQPSAAPPQPQPQPKAQPQAQPQRQPRKFQPPKQSAPERPQGFGGGQPGMSRSRPDYRQYQPQPPRKVRQQPAPQAKPRVRQQPRPQPRPQVRQQPAPQPRPQVRQQPRPQMRPQVSQQPRPQPQRQVRQQPRPQARPQAQKRPQPQQGRDKQPSQQN